MADPYTAYSPYPGSSASIGEVIKEVWEPVDEWIHSLDPQKLQTVGRYSGDIGAVAGAVDFVLAVAIGAGVTVVAGPAIVAGATAVGFVAGLTGAVVGGLQWYREDVTPEEGFASVLYNGAGAIFSGMGRSVTKLNKVVSENADTMWAGVSFVKARAWAIATGVWSLAQELSRNEGSKPKEDTGVLNGRPAGVRRIRRHFVYSG